MIRPSALGEMKRVGIEVGLHELHLGSHSAEGKLKHMVVWAQGCVMSPGVPGALIWTQTNGEPLLGFPHPMEHALSWVSCPQALAAGAPKWAPHL